MSTVAILIKRNIKLFFKDKGMFFVSLITPAILLVLYTTFLGKVYRESFVSNIPSDFALSDKIINGLVGGELVSSILAVSCVTVTFCVNFLMVQDKANGVIKDFKISPVKSPVLAFSYYLAALAAALIICFATMALCLIYLSITGWCMSFADVLLLALDVILLVLFGSALSSVINFFLSTQGQISAVGTIVSSCYGFICGAYMPISSFSVGMQKVISFLPGTYGTSLVRNHSMRGAFQQMLASGVPAEIVEDAKKSVDCSIAFFGNNVQIYAMYIILGATVAVLLGVYVLLNYLKKDK